MAAAEENISYLWGLKLLFVMDFIIGNNLSGVVIGALTFLVIGLFHPLVIKGEYYFGVGCWWASSSWELPESSDRCSWRTLSCRRCAA